MQMPPLPDQQRVYSALLFEIGAPHNPKAGVSVLEGLTRTLLHAMKPRMLVVDEVHHRRPQGRAAPSPAPAGGKEPWGGPAFP